jgi:ADP-ribosyltransferase exoenzyme
MCYPKPGPRCSAHAAKKLAEARLLARIERSNNYNDFAKYQKLAEDAQKVYDATPAGITELKRRVAQSKNSVHITRLKLAQETRKQQLEALKRADEGDIKHSDTFEETSYGINEFLPKNKTRKALKDDSEIMKKFLEDSHNWVSQLTTEEIEAVAWFTSDGSTSLNNYVVGQEDRSPFHYSKTYLEKQKKSLESALSKINRSEPVIVYRGVKKETLEKLLNSSIINKLEDLEDLEDLKTKDIEKVFEKGKTLTSPTFMSASPDPYIATKFSHGVVFEIKSYSAAPAVTLSAWNFAENEMVLPRDKEYKIVNVLQKVNFEKRGDNDSQKITVVQLEEVI